MVRGGCSVASGPAPQGGCARREGEYPGPGPCMKPLDPSRKRRQWPSLHGCRFPCGPQLRLPAVVGRMSRGPVETRIRRYRRRGGRQNVWGSLRRQSVGFPVPWSWPWALMVCEWLNEHGCWHTYIHHIEEVVLADPRVWGGMVLGQVDSRFTPYIIGLQSINSSTKTRVSRPQPFSVPRTPTP